MLYTIDEYGKDVLLQGGKNRQVMMEWEIPYMNALIDNVKPKDLDVLEIGYGMGYSAKRIQSYKPKSHTGIECDDTVINKAKKDGLDIEIVKGRWQKAIHSLGNYDFIFFDDHSYEDWNNELDRIEDCKRAEMFIDICIDWHLNPGGMISFYINTEEHNFKHNRVEYSEKIIDVDIPDNCEYRQGSKCILPLIKVNNVINR